MTARRLNYRSVGFAIVGAVLLAACAGEQITAPAAPTVSADRGAKSAGEHGGDHGPGRTHLAPTPLIPTATIGYATIAQRDTSLTTDISVSRTIGHGGAVLRIPAAGLTVVFSPGAVQAPTTVTLTAHAGRMVSYSFEPHGIVFQKPVLVIQSVSHTTAARAETVSGVYLANDLRDITADGTAAVAEFLPARTFTGLVSGVVTQAAVFPIWHFSGYALATGRSGNF